LRSLKLVTPTPHLTIPQRRLFGKRRRSVLPRVKQAIWGVPPRRRDPVELLLAANRNRLPHLLPVKWGRMAASPFGFFRGAAPLMAADLASRPVSGLKVQICGDAHVKNLGAYAAPDGHLVFDINDFDETLEAPWEWDLKRLATSFVLAGRKARMRDRTSADAVEALGASYRTTLHALSSMPVLELARYQVRRYLEEGPVRQLLRKAERATPLETLRKLTVPRRGGGRRFANRPPLLERVSDATRRTVLQSLHSYGEPLDADRKLVLTQYRAADVAFKVVGAGSVGTRDYVVLTFGNGPDDPLFLQVKEELPSCWAPYLPRPAGARHQGQRVCEGQHRLQTLSDPLLGWTTIERRQYLVRQLADHKASIEPEELRGNGLLEYALVCGETFAKAHARTGDAAALSGYLGTTDRMDRALARFALAYADQTEADYALFMKAVRARKIPVRRGI
jgi:uncharacterized protein (DUF2252 family)